MKSLSPQLDGKIVAAGWSFGMRLYNRSIPVLNGYTFNYYNRPENYRAAIDAVFDSKAACCMLLGEKTFETVFPGDKRFTKIGSIAFGDVTGQESMGIFFPRSAGIQEPVRE